jgi:putative ABC transport system ATP-binding protein
MLELLHLQKVEFGDRLMMMHQGGIVIDKHGGEKAATRLEDVLSVFTEISIELGN